MEIYRPNTTFSDRNIDFAWVSITTALIAFVRIVGVEVRRFPKAEIVYLVDRTISNKAIKVEAPGLLEWISRWPPPQLRAVVS